uniref:Uncharacterized protein n=1 Tax=Arundo donax TaxID=35708 RepID=A0A0A9H0J1_ARUDO
MTVRAVNVGFCFNRRVKFKYSYRKQRMHLAFGVRGSMAQVTALCCSNMMLQCCNIRLLDIHMMHFSH